jgi:hypothetical protein
VPSDALDLLGDRIISTCYDINQVNSPDLKIFQASPPTVLNPCTGFCPGGFATDVVVGSAPVNMTPLGITRNEWADVEFYNLTTGAAWIPAVTPASTSGLCGWFGSGIGMSDSLKFTANRIAVLTNQMEPQTQGPMGAPPRGYLSVLHIGVQPAGWPKENGFTPCGFSPPNGHELVHDLATTPDEELVVVSGTRVIGLYSLKTGAPVHVIQNATLPTPNFKYIPLSLLTADSVEVTNSRAVIIGNDHAYAGIQLPEPVPPSTDPVGFRIALMQLRPPYTHVVFDTAMLGLTAPARVHDVAITPNGSKAVVTTRAGTLVLDLTSPITTTPPGPFPALAPTVADPLNFNGNVVVSDSVACTDTFAVVIGRDQQMAPQGMVQIIDLTSPALTVKTVNLGNPGDWIPTDVTMTPDGTKALVRSLRPGVTTDGRITVIDVVQGVPIYDVSSSPVGASDLGNTSGCDHVEATNEFAISAGINRLQILKF